MVQPTRSREGSGGTLRPPELRAWASVTSLPCLRSPSVLWGSFSMATGWLTWTVLLLASGAPQADDFIHMNQRGFQIPINIQPERKSEVRELILYISRDQGKTWGIQSRAGAAAKGFDFFADGEGLHYFSVQVTDQRGKQDPPDIYDPSVK